MKKHDIGNTWLTPSQAAEYIGASEATLARWRSARRGPTYHPLSSRMVRYARADVDAWVARSRRETLDGGGE